MAHHSNPVTVAIMGGSAAGKTTFAQALAEELQDFSSIVLHQDAYFRDWAEYPPEVRSRIATSNHPDGVCWEALIGHIEQLQARQPIQTPAPGTRGGRNAPPSTISPADLVIVEGHLILWHERLREIMDIKLFLDVDMDERLIRRLMRHVEHGGDLDAAVAWYRRDVIPNFSVYTEPCKQYADLILPLLHEKPVAMQVVAAGVREQLLARQHAGTSEATN